MTITRVRPSVELRGVRRSFGDRVVLNGIDLTIASGEFVALLGQSGTGKSTLLRALAGLDPAVEGYISVPRQRAVVFQEPRLMPWKKVWRNVTLGLEKGGDRKQVQAMARQALAEVGLTSHEDAWPATLSGGEAQRVALARALARSPDALTRLKMQALVAKLCLRYNPAVLLVTHDVDEAIALAQRILVLRDGRFVTDIPVDIPTPRHRGGNEFGRLRSRLLADLGVEESEL